MATKITKINQIAKEKTNEVFTSIFHLINKELLNECLEELMVKLNEDKLDDLVKKLKKYTPKKTIDIENKIVQLALKKILEAIYEPKFSNKIFGFRTKQCHDILKEVVNDVEKNTNYIVKMSIDINNDQLINCLKLYIKDPNILELIKKFLKVGILDKELFKTKEYVIPKNLILTPILLNIYIDYTFIKWFDKIKNKGFMSVISGANDFIFCFQYEKEAEIFYQKLEQLNLCSEMKLISLKTSKKVTFNFLGFTHYFDDEFKLKRKTASKNFTQKLVEFNQWCKRNNLPLKKTMIIVKKRLIEHYNYFGIQDNYYMIKKFYYRSLQILFKWLNRRSQRKSYTWKEFIKIVKKYNILPPKQFDSYEEPSAGKLHARFCAMLST